MRGEADPFPVGGLEGEAGSSSEEISPSRSNMVACEKGVRRDGGLFGWCCLGFLGLVFV